MSLEDLLQVSLWQRFSKKMQEKILKPRSCGYFEKSDALERGMRLVIGKGGEPQDEIVILYWLVDNSDGIIVDVKFQAFGRPSLIAAAEGASELLISKNYEQARRINADLIDKQLRDFSDQTAFPEETLYHLNLVLEAIENAVAECGDIPLPEKYSTPIMQEQNEGEAYPGWIDLPREKKLIVIEEVLNAEIRPYIELDAGGIEVRDLVADKELIISYQGACTTCYSSIGATLSTIQQIIQAKVHPEIIVVPDMEDLHL